MDQAAVVHEIVVNAGQAAEGLQTPCLVGRTDAIMFDCETMVEARMSQLQLFQHIQGHLYSFVAIRMAMYLNAGPPIGQHRLDQFLPRRLATMTFMAIQITWITQPQRHCRVRAVIDELDTMDSKLIRISLLQL